MPRATVNEREARAEKNTPLDSRARWLWQLLVVLTDVRRMPLPSFSDPCFARWFTRAAGVVEGKEVGAASRASPKAKGGKDGAPPSVGARFGVASKEEAARYAAAERAAKQWLRQEASLSASLVSELSHFEEIVGYRMQRGVAAAAAAGAADPTDAGWHVIAEALYPFEGAAGFVRFKRVAEAAAKIEGDAKKDTRVKMLVSSYG